MVKNVSGLLLLILLTANIYGQVKRDSIPSYELEYYQPAAYFSGFHGYYLTSIEYIPVQKEFFKKLIENEDIPAVELKPACTLAWFSFMRNWMYTNLSYSYLFNEEAVKDSLISKLNQNSVAIRFGYNLIAKQKVVLSPYIGLRYTAFSHKTSLKWKNITLEEYMSVRTIDLRVSQFSGEIGINSTFLASERWSFGFYASYMFDFSSRPIIRTKGNRIIHDAGNPVDNFVFGLGLGFGFNTF